MSSHGWGQNSRLHCRSSIVSDSHPFRSLSIGRFIPRIQLFVNLTLNVQGQGHSSKSHSASNILSTHISFVPCESTHLFLTSCAFQIWPWKPKVKVKAISKFKITKWVRVLFDSHPFRSMSISDPIPAIRLVQNLTLKIQVQGQSSRSHSGFILLSTHIPFVACHSKPPFPICAYFKIWPWKYMVKHMGEVKGRGCIISPASVRCSCLCLT